MSPQKCGRYAGIAQSVEHFTRNEGVVSSSLISGFTIKRRNPSDTEGLRFFVMKGGICRETDRRSKENV